MDLEKFYDEYVDKVYKFFYIKSLNKMTAEDLTSETFVLFLHQIKGRKVDDSKKYLYGIMRNVWLEFLKDKYKAQLSSVEKIENFEEYAVNAIQIFDDTKEPMTRLRPYVELLPDKQRQVLVMRTYSGMNIKETAQALGRNAGYVKTTYARAIKSLRAIIEKPYMNEGVIDE